MEQGPCNGTFENWFFEKESDTCRPFLYGGCKGNDNRYATESACNYHCKRPGVQKSKQLCKCNFGFSIWFELGFWRWVQQLTYCSFGFWFGFCLIELANTIFARTRTHLHIEYACLHAHFRQLRSA